MTAHWRWGVALATAVYVLLGVVFIAQDPGLQYDEALQVLGTVHMLTSKGPLTVPHDPDTWLCAGERCLPLMTVRYTGAIKEYLLLPFFAIFGPCSVLVRCVALAFGATGIFGLGWLLARHVAPAVGIATSLVLAVHPAYVDLTIFDNGTVSVWMAALGLTALALSGYIARPAPASAFLLGAAVGFGVWLRANYLWMAAALFLAAVIVLRKRILRPPREWAAAAAGGVVGAAPFLLYQIISGGGTFEAVGMFQVSTSYGEMLQQRLTMLREVLLSDREHRAIWDGPPMPEWQFVLFPVLVLLAFIACLVAPGKMREWSRGVAIAFLALAAAMFLSRMPVAEHHLIGLVPLAAAMTVVAVYQLPAARYVGAALAVIYGVAALGWQAAAIKGLAETGGVGQWSDSIVEFTDYLTTHHASKQVQILDWGLQNNLYVLSNGRIRSQEIYPNATREHNRHGRPWTEEIRRGGLFVLNGEGNRQFPEASEGFLGAIAEARPKMKRWRLRQQNGQEFAEIIEIEPVASPSTPR